MKKTKFKNKFKLISTTDQHRIKGGAHNNNGSNSGGNSNTGGVPPYKPKGGDDRDD